MEFSFDRSYEILDRTPAIMRSILSGLSDDWTMNNEGPDTFSPYDVIGHLIHGELTDWSSRAKMILEDGTSKKFVPYDRFAMYEESKGKSLSQLLDEFESLRKQNMAWLRSMNVTETDLEKKGVHPTFGDVTLRQLLATWVVHDLTHISQVTRVMAKQYKAAIGPWTQFFRVLEF